METPRPSKKQDRIRERFINVAKKLGLEYEMDKGGNVRIRKYVSHCGLRCLLIHCRFHLLRPATKGRENAPGIVLQSHMDVVCSKNKDVEHNFETDPVDAYIQDNVRFTPFPLSSAFLCVCGAWRSFAEQSTGDTDSLISCVSVAYSF